MEEKLRSIIFVIAFFGSQVFLYGQVTSEYPPEPDSQETTDSICGTGDGGWPGGIPPPVGRCLPIDDYVLPLLLFGIALGGGFYLLEIEKKRGAKNSVL